MADIKYLDKTGLGTVKSILDGLFASKAHNHDDTYAPKSHGNHVPAIQTASNKVFLRNDNTWQTITPTNIGAATSGHTHSLGNKSASDLSSTYPEGISIGGIYNNGYPFSYGSTITACGNGGYFQIAGQWNSDVTSLTDYDKPTEMYIRGRRDSYDVWTTWSRVLTNRNYTSCINTTNFPGINKTGTVTKVSTGTGLTGGDITGTGTISINSTYQTYISNGNTAHGWGNHADAGYVKSSGVTKVSTGTGLTGGDITGTGTISINSTYQTYISNGNTAHGWGNHANAGYMKTSQYGYSPDTYTFNIAQNDKGWVYLGYFYGSNTGLKIECDYASHCGNDYGLFASHLVLGVRPYSLEGFISKVKGSSGGLYITEEGASGGYKNYHVYIYLKAWYQGQVRISGLGSNTFNWSKTEAAPNSSHTVVLDTRELDGYYICHKGTITKVSTEGHTHNYWTYNEVTIKGVKVDNAVYADSAGSAVDQTARNTANAKWTYNEDTIKAVKVNNAGSSDIADKLRASDNSITSTSNDTTAKWGALHNTIHFYATTGQLKDQPSQYGLVLNFNNSGSEVHQFWLTQASGDAYHRGGNSSGWSGTWRKFLDSSNYTNYINTTNFPGLNSTGDITGVTAGDGLGGGGTSGAVTLTNAGVRSTTINGNYLRVNTNGTNTDLTIPYATTSGSCTGNAATSSSCTGNAATATTATTATKAAYLTKCVSSVTATTRSTDHGHSMALFTSGWASNSAGFHTTYGTTLDLSGYSTWYHRLAFGTDGQIEHWMGINTNTLTNQGRLCYTNHSHTSFNNNISVTGSVTASAGFFDNSDERLKDIIDNINVDIDKLSALRKVYFNFKNDTDKKHIGVIAQDVQKIYPEIVEENGDGMLTVDYSKLSVIALDAVDQLNQKNKELEDRLNKIENLLKDKGIL